VAPILLEITDKGLEKVSDYIKKAAHFNVG
jgi:hypothetical protein